MRRVRPNGVDPRAQLCRKASLSADEKVTLTLFILGFLRIAGRTKEKGGAFPPRPWPPRRRMLLGDVGVMVEKLLQRHSGNAFERDDRNGRRLARAAGIDADHGVAAGGFDGEPGAQVGVGCIHPREYITQIQLIIIPERETVVCPLLFLILDKQADGTPRVSGLRRRTG